MKQNKKTPALRFPEFSGEWEVKKFSDIFSFRSTNSFSRDNLNYENGYTKNIHYGDVHTKFSTLFDVTKELVPFVNSEIELNKIPEDNYCKIGDLIIADASEDYEDIGKCVEIKNLNNEKVLSGLHTILARPDLYKMFVGFNGYLMKSSPIRLQIKIIAQGSKVLSISSKRLSELKIFIPCFEEQQKIADFILQIDNRIEKLTKKKELLEKYKKGVMQKIFNQEIRFKNDNDDDYSDWEIKELGTITKIYDGTHMTPDYKENGIPFYSVENITNNNFVNTKFISKNVFEKENKRVKLEKEDILMTKIGDIGTAKYIDWDVEASFYVSLALIKKNKNNNTKFISQYIKSSFFKKELHKRIIHVAFPKKINLGEISNCLIKLPCLEEQQKIANFLTEIDKKINLTEKQLNGTRQYKKGLLQQMFI